MAIFHVSFGKTSFAISLIWLIKHDHSHQFINGNTSYYFTKLFLRRIVF